VEEEEVATLKRLEDLHWENEQQENSWWHELLVGAAGRTQLLLRQQAPRRWASAR
jgi:hypothetical protein